MPAGDHFHNRYRVELVMVRSIVRTGCPSCPERRNISARLATNGRKSAAMAVCRISTFRHWRVLRGDFINTLVYPAACKGAWRKSVNPSLRFLLTRPSGRSQIPERELLSSLPVEGRRHRRCLRRLPRRRSLHRLRRWGFAASKASSGHPPSDSACRPQRRRTVRSERQRENLPCHSSGQS